jgi:transcriptional regulator with XRE-family HTH domain
MARSSRATNRNSRIATAFGKLLAELRKKRGLSQDRFAAGAGFHKNSIGMFERGEISPKLEAVFDLADALEMPASKLLAILEKKLRS